MKGLRQREMEGRYQAWARQLASETTETPTDPEGVDLLTPGELLDRIWDR